MPVNPQNKTVSILKFLWALFVSLFVSLFVVLFAVASGVAPGPFYLGFFWCKIKYTRAMTERFAVKTMPVQPGVEKIDICKTSRAGMLRLVRDDRLPVPAWGGFDVYLSSTCRTLQLFYEQLFGRRTPNDPAHRACKLFCGLRALY